MSFDFHEPKLSYLINVRAWEIGSPIVWQTFQTKVKETVLLAYDQVQETYRQKIIGLTKSHGNTFVEFADELVRLFDQWLKSAGVVDYLSLK